MATLIQLIAAFLVSIIGAWVSALAGGGSLLVTPVLLALGVPPTILVGSRRVSGLGMFAGSFREFHKAGKIDYKLSITLTACAIVGTVAGFVLVQTFNPIALERFIACAVLALVGIAILKDRYPGMLRIEFFIQHASTLGPLLFIPSFALSLLAGAGSGILVSFILTGLYGKGVLESSGTRRIPGLIAGILGSVLFISVGSIDYVLAAVLFVGYALGSFFGSRFHLQRGEKAALKWFYGISIISSLAVLIGL